VKLATALHDEWKYRYNHPAQRIHKSYERILYADSLVSSMEFPSNGLTPFAQAMPDKYKKEDAVSAYREYYRKDEKKRLLASWKRRAMPSWYL
jgi:hypothetical protein